MARVTVEDCIERLENRFELVMVAAQRARQIGSGAALTVDRDNDKNPVVSLREIADETVDVETLKEDLIRGKQRIVALDDDDEDVIDMMDGEAEWETMSQPAASGADGSASGEALSPEASSLEGHGRRGGYAGLIAGLFLFSCLFVFNPKRGRGTKIRKWLFDLHNIPPIIPSEREESLQVASGSDSSHTLGMTGLGFLYKPGYLIPFRRRLSSVKDGVSRYWG